jgi:hypothetical protein
MKISKKYVGLAVCLTLHTMVVPQPTKEQEVRSNVNARSGKIGEAVEVPEVRHRHVEVERPLPGSVIRPGQGGAGIMPQPIPGQGVVNPPSPKERLEIAGRNWGPHRVPRAIATPAINPARIARKALQAQMDKLIVELKNTPQEELAKDILTKFLEYSNKSCAY